MLCLRAVWRGNAEALSHIQLRSNPPRQFYQAVFLFWLGRKAKARSPSGKTKLCKTCLNQRFHAGSIAYKDLNRGK